MKPGYIQFEESPEAMALLKKGMAISVEVIFDDDIYWEDRDKRNYMAQLGFDKETDFMPVTILSEIGNMQGHYVVVGNDGRIVPGLHGDIFFVHEDTL